MWGQTLWNGNEADHCFVISPRLLDLQLVFPDWIPRPDRDKMGQKQTTANAPRGLVIQAHIVCCETAFARDSIPSRRCDRQSSRLLPAVRPFSMNLGKWPANRRSPARCDLILPFAPPSQGDRRPQCRGNAQYAQAWSGRGAVARREGSSFPGKSMRPSCAAWHAFRTPYPQARYRMTATAENGHLLECWKQSGNERWDGFTAA